MLLHYYSIFMLEECGCKHCIIPYLVIYKTSFVLLKKKNPKKSRSVLHNRARFWDCFGKEIASLTRITQDFVLDIFFIEGTTSYLKTKLMLQIYSISGCQSRGTCFSPCFSSLLDETLNSGPVSI